MDKGKLIVVEGCDCSGKETQSTILERKLKAKGTKVVHLSFPMYDTPTGKIVGEALLGRNGESWFQEGSTHVDPKIACLYYAADRKYNYSKIKDYLNQGYFVILDRYVSSNMAHQGSKIEDSEERFNFFKWIDKLEYWLLELPKADITIFLHVPYHLLKELSKTRQTLDGNEKDEEYQKNTEKVYMELSQLYNWNVVNCSIDNQLRTIEEINQDILKIVMEK